MSAQFFPLVCACYLVVKPLGDLKRVNENAFVEVPHKGALSYGNGNGFHELL